MCSFRLVPLNSHYCPPLQSRKQESGACKVSRPWGVEPTVQVSGTGTVLAHLTLLFMKARTGLCVLGIKQHRQQQPTLSIRKC